MTVYLITFLGVGLCGLASGRRLSRRLPESENKFVFKTAYSVLWLSILCILCVLAARLARAYADTDWPGATVAEWFAHFFRWWILLAAAMFVHGLACGMKQLPRSWPRRAVYFGALLVVTGLVGFRTVPVYFLLGDGQRDANGFLRQSVKYEYTCAAVALLNYLEQYRGIKGLTEREVSKRCGITTQGAIIEGLLRAAHSYGLTHATARVLNMTELEQLGHPAIVSLSSLPGVHHATLLVKLDVQQAYFIDPAYGRWNLPRDRFQKVWYGKTVLLE